MKIVIAPDSFKGSLSSIEVIKAIKTQAVSIFPDVEIIEIPIADGGEGTVDALIRASNGQIKKHTVESPTGDLVEASYGVINDTAVIEMAMCSGLPLVDKDMRNPALTSSYGTGQMIKYVIEKGYRNIIIGIGGSATNDGGTGAMQALGAEFFDIDGNNIGKGCGDKLGKINSISLNGMDKNIADCNISVMCDVTNPLTGEKGATYMYGKQKGGTPKMLDELEQGMLSYRDKLQEHFGQDIGARAGAGAAGGIGAALMAFCDAKLVRGIDAVLKIADFSTKIKNADLIITGEGKIDEQSAFGKVIHGVTNYANKEKVPVIAIAGCIGDGVEVVYSLGVKAIFTLPSAPMSLDACMIDAKKLIANASKNMFEAIKIGMNI